MRLCTMIPKNAPPNVQKRLFQSQILCTRYIHWHIYRLNVDMRPLAQVNSLASVTNTRAFGQLARIPIIDHELGMVPTVFSLIIS
jgi:hypothetical protein